jgi:hypothetical protein
LHGLAKFLHQAHVSIGPAPMLFAKCYSAQVGRGSSNASLPLGLALRQLCTLFRHYKPVRQRYASLIALAGDGLLTLHALLKIGPLKTCF